MKIYIDVTTFLKSNIITGIQRVVREVVLGLLGRDDFEIVLLANDSTKIKFSVIEKEIFLKKINNNPAENTALPRSTKKIALKDFEPESLFFEIDDAWSLKCKRSILYPRLKERGVKIVVFVHDIIPIIRPEFCTERTIFIFMNYICATLIHSDKIITSTKAVLDSVEDLANKLGLLPVNGSVSWLGSDFCDSNFTEKKENVSKNTISPDAMSIAQKGKFILLVGTLEPRKNHKLLLDAWDSGLKDLGINFVFAGRHGWNIEDFIVRMENHPDFGKRIFHLEGLDDASIDFLYKNAYLVAFPTFDEGFGLPIIEALQRKCVVIASDIPVMREIGKDFVLYVSPDDPNDVVKTVKNMIENQSEYENKKNKVENFSAVTWNEVTTNFCDILKGLS